MPHPQLSRFELENFGKIAANSYLDDGVNLNETITKLAREHSFSDHQIDRVAQNANILVNGALVTQARDRGSDPRVTFPLADSSSIAESLRENKVARLRKEAEILDLFTVPRAAPPSVIDKTVGEMAPDPYANQSLSRDHEKLAADFMRGQVQDVERTDAQTLSYVCTTLENLQHRALTRHNLDKMAMDDSESELRQEINDQLLSGMSPATVRDVIKSANLDQKTTVYIDRLVTKVAAGLRAREGKSAFVDGSLVNREHPLITKAAEVRDKVAAAVTSRRGLDKLAGAHQHARVEYTRAVREGR